VSLAKANKKKRTGWVATVLHGKDSQKRRGGRVVLLMVDYNYYYFFMSSTVVDEWK